MSRPRIRSLKPECWQDERVGSLSRDARLLFVGLITMADDEGRLRAQPSMLIGSIFPWDEVHPRKLAEWLEEIEAQQLVARYERDGKPYVALRNWRRHQRINRPTPSELPPPPIHAIVRANSVSVHGEPSVKEHAPFTPSRGRGSEGIGEEGNLPQTPPQAGGLRVGPVEASPGVPKNSRAAGTNPRAVAAAAAETANAESAQAAVAALTDPTDEQRAGWERLRAAMQTALGDGASWALYAEEFSLAGVAAPDVLVIDGPPASWSWTRAWTLIARCTDVVGVSARLATEAEHEGLALGAAA